MYKLLLSWRYLRTRYIALASVVSVTLGVATLIVVNSVMDGFAEEMHKRLHDVLSDIVFEGQGLEGLADADFYEQEIRRVVGNDLESVTHVIHLPAMASISVRGGQSINQYVNLIGVDEKTYGTVCDFSQFLLHPKNREKISFHLREDGYDPRIAGAGWGHRRMWAAWEKAYQEQLQQDQRRMLMQHPRPSPEPQTGAIEESAPFNPIRDGEPSGATADLDAIAGEPDFPQPGPSENADSKPAIDPSEPTFAGELADSPVARQPGTGRNPFDQFRREEPEQQNVFDPAAEQHPGVVLGIAMASRRQRDENGEVQDYFFVQPGDDVQISFPSAGNPPKPLSASFTVVDLYESKMSEYDSTFAFVPLRTLQELRNMIDPLTGTAAVTSIQLKLKPGADLKAVQAKLLERFPGERYPYRIRTWKDLQGPLLQAVQMETTILNILLFLIIAVAGFGILATFFMIVVEKTRDIGILKALGAPSRGVMSIFLGYGLSLGLVGSGVGMVLGLLFVIYINDIADLLERITGREVFDPTIYYFSEIPTIINPLTIAWIVAGSVLIAVMASVLPALRAARLHPVQALRYE
jgi:lipoprotein-releasing system permease protein